MSYATVVDTAISQVGTTEYPPNSNKVKYNTEYYGQEVSGDAYPWCITFLWWCFTHGGESAAFYGGNKTASSTQLMNYYIGQEQFVTSGYKIGDIVFYNFSGGSGADHAEIIISVGNGVYVTVGGNTTPGDEGSQNNGGCVARKTRYASQFLGAGRPSYGSSGGGSTEPTALRTKIIQATSRVLAMRHLVPESVAAIGKAEVGPFSISDTWWVDYRGRIYDRSGNYLRVRDGFTGEVLDMTEPCLGRNTDTSKRLRVFDNVLGYCVKRETEEDNHQTWRFRYYDGTVTEIKMPFVAESSGVYFTNYYYPIWGYSNGILAISYDGANNQCCWTYTKNGNFIFETANLSGGVRWPSIERVFPLSGYSVGVIKSGSNGAETYYWDSYSILSDIGIGGRFRNGDIGIRAFSCEMGQDMVKWRKTNTEDTLCSTAIPPRRWIFSGASGSTTTGTGSRLIKTIIPNISTTPPRSWGPTSSSPSWICPASCARSAASTGMPGSTRRCPTRRACGFASARMWSGGRTIPACILRSTPRASTTAASSGIPDPRRWRNSAGRSPVTRRPS